MACVLWGKEWKKKGLLFHCDNLATVQIINKGRSKCKLIMSLMRKLAYVSATGNFIVHAEHIPGVKNTKAKIKLVWIITNCLLCIN